MATNQGGPMTPHADLVARLRAIASANICDLLNMGDESHEPPEITWGELDDIGRAAQEAADALAALPPPADPPHDCEAWRLEGLGCARCNKADPPTLVALVREWQEAMEPWLNGKAETRADVDAAETILLAYPLPAAPPLTDTGKESR